ncbi:evolutionarily conserved signaling intermediate in Toll pathway, mitochondrial [Nasonia vitripennis]|uniref:Evolutionarily conserved signaling intermediate in Toll pathway, mitochondrial n=1 Tax=Nasonia vitripennis TaxID=7425 RepID=A0A7M7QSZ2_NASVI|nr:evolutionarily conserved signaling intermediate in Toll pathway, mitochondrial [Nasonia vitripennis]XP_031778176.1 evolutionarily conserved signaling intermediate in Toll pathway, mitochondrial [Nasonia vitripennis]XP_032452343.1 evolutionarily conserved signaling intermediate in Toll pathway, mitochondrial [Nasonia vitripennis]
MFTRIIRQSVPLGGICKSYSNRTCRLHNNMKLSLKYVQSSRQYGKTPSLLLANQQSPKEKLTEINNEINKEPNTDKNNETQKDSQERSDQNQEKPKEESRSEDEKDDKRKGRSSVFAKALVLHAFENARKKEKETFLECLRMYQNQPGIKQERVPFIYTALKYMEEFGVHKDLSVYKQLIDIFPKQKMIPSNLFQGMFLYYPKEQYCATAVLEQMEDNGVIPDPEMELMLLNIFGRHGMPLEKYWKMMYWQPKFKNLNPWPVPQPIPTDLRELAWYAMNKISSIDVRSVVTDFNTEDVPDSIDKTWIVSAMAPDQSELLKKHDKSKPIYVEGPFQIYVSIHAMDYFTLRTDPIHDRKFPEEDTDDVKKLRNPYTEIRTSEVILPPTVHEQEDGTIFANCCTGTSSKDSLLSWIRCLQKDNPVLAEIPIVFTLRKQFQDERYLDSGNKQQVPDSESKKDDDDKLLQ